MDGCVAEAFRRLKDAGVTPVLLKGQAYSRHYPQSSLRQCGDIDIYVGESNYYPAYEAACRFGWESKEKFVPDVKHYGCYLRNVRIELHRLAGKFPSRSVNSRFQEWSRRQLLSGLNSTVIEGEEIQLPTPVFDVVFVFMHLYLHFMNSGIGLRHICDWVMLLHAHSEVLDRQELKARLEDFRLLKAWRLFTPIAVEQLGLPETECPFYSPQYRKKSTKIFAFILKEGNFGKYTSDSCTRRPDGYLSGKLYSFRRHSNKMLSCLPLDPVTITGCYGNFLFKGVRATFKDMLNRMNK